MRPPRCLLFAAFVFFAGTLPATRAEEPFFKKGDVIAIVGGEDMVALSEYGYLELLLTRALPDSHLRFRNLAWEGDTVFEQRRDLGFPTWEEQLEKIGATVVLCQFGQMESLGKGEGRKAKGDGASKEEVAEFSAAYEKLVARFSGGGKRKILIVPPTGFAPGFGPHVESQEFQLALGAAGKAVPLVWRIGGAFLSAPANGWRDGIHLSNAGQAGLANGIGSAILRILSGFGEPGNVIHFSDYRPRFPFTPLPQQGGPLANDGEENLRQRIIAKNRLWFDYWRVQNWAFLAGDRTNQPSSRDHLDPAKRWFPAERERFLPLIEAREKEIDALAAKLAQP